ncbi:heme oxygenase [Actinoplanes campanulatus]|uniref:Heme oxygenase n=1 Tax=Actinoplanes campanulatus TaxID=113559 RepID=A0A7W5ALE4_9ACTN|nr:biliverdin-producing heme oxygenase [Actinoplanes campanulatus]MBB3098240.1 heme oxygenase [Actinoplanes campanulatus]GGN34783.1 heme oxygenase [Actinoplanes campanulatus]GID38802.1 heme oxygenase [Actinoplanes campanulatus]
MTDFSTRIRRATMVEHREAETRSFISRLMAGSVPMAGYAALTAQYLTIYRELESAAAHMRTAAPSSPTNRATAGSSSGPASDRVGAGSVSGSAAELVAGFADPALTRVPSLEADLAHLYGPDWESVITVLDSTRRYAERLRAQAATSPTHFIAHHYVRYLGDLSGGQMIGRTLANLYGLGEAGTSFYRFEQIPDPRAYKIAYRARLDALDLTEDQAEIMLAEARLAFRCNADIFVELGAHYPENPEDLAPAA